MELHGEPSSPGGDARLSTVHGNARTRVRPHSIPNQVGRDSRIHRTDFGRPTGRHGNDSVAWDTTGSKEKEGNRRSNSKTNTEQDLARADSSATPGRRDETLSRESTQQTEKERLHGRTGLGNHLK